MELFFQIYSVVAAVAAALFATVICAEWLSARRRRCRDAVLRKKYLHIVMLALMSDDDRVPHFPRLHRIGARLLLVETLAGIMRATCAIDRRPLRRIVESYRLDEWLYGRIRWSRGFRRARYLALLAALPVNERWAERVAAYAGSRNRAVRFCTLLVQLSVAPSSSLRRMAVYPDSLSECETAEILALLRQGQLPIAYEPLLTASPPNLRRVGLGIVRQFGIGEAHAQLLRLTVDDPCSEIGREALHTLCSLRRPVVRQEVAARIDGLSESERRALLRRMVREGYSTAALRRLFGAEKALYGEALERTYKRCLTCS